VAEDVHGRSPARWARVVVLAWPLLLAVVLVWPLLSRPGHPLSRDLVFLPQHPLTWSAAGLADGSPRAVPLDTVLALLTSVVDGGVLARVLLPGILVLAAAGVMRLLPGSGTAGLLVAGGVAAWNPFVVERLALGQWALLTSYAAPPWLVRASTRAAPADHTGRAPGRRTPPVVGWAALASLTPTGGVLALAVVAVQVVLRRAGSSILLGAVLLLQLPWIVAGLVGSATTVSDPAGVSAFAPDSEGPFGVWVALLGLGGIWDARSEPSSRTTLLAPLTALVVVMVLLAAGRELHRRVPGASTWWTLGAGGLVLAMAAATGPGQALLRLVVAHVPAGGLLRDTQKFLLPTVLLVALAAGVATDRVARSLGRRWADAPELRMVLLLPVVLGPVLLLPDGARPVWTTVEPVDLPASFAEADRLTRGSDSVVVTLPWRSYRLFEWGNGTTSSDPAVRALHARVLVSDDLQVGSRVVRGEGALARRVGEVLAAGGAARDLGELGIGWVLVYPDDPDAATLDVGGLEQRYADEVLVLYRVPGAVAAPAVPRGDRVLLGGAYAAAAAVLVAAALAAVGGAVRARPRRRR
jgi:hypothetical protein